MEYTPENITSLQENEVFVFGSNLSGFHGAGAAGYAFAGDPYAYQNGKLNVPDGTVGKWAIKGCSRGFQVGNEGLSYAIQTVTFPGKRKSVPLKEIHSQLRTLYTFAVSNLNLKFYVTKIGVNYAGYSILEIKSCFDKLTFLPNNVVLPREFI